MKFCSKYKFNFNFKRIEYNIIKNSFIEDEYIISDDVVAMVLKKESAVMDFRDLIGATDPLQARACTIRRKYGIDKGMNSIHGSDSDESSERESSFFDL